MSDDDKKLEEVAARETIVHALKGKIQSLAKKRTDVLESLAPNVRKRVEALKEIQDEHDDLEKKFFEERAALEDKYQKLYEPLYTKRYEIVNGDVEVKGVTNETAEKAPDEDKGSEEKGVPNFWLTAMKANDVLEEEIQEHDEEALKFLKDIKWSRVDNPKGFKLEFFFNPNPYFKNTVLTKTYIMIDEDESILEKAIGTEIEWFPGKCLTQKLQKKKPKKGSKNAKPVTKMQNCESLFNFFSPPQVPDDDASNDIDEDTAEELENQMEADYDIGSTIRDQIIPHAVSWYTGEAIQEEDFEIIGNIEDADGDENEEDDEDEEDDDEEEDDNDEEESANVQKKKSGVASAGDGQQG